MKELTNRLAGHADTLVLLFLALAVFWLAVMTIKYFLKKKNERENSAGEAAWMEPFLRDNTFQVYLCVRGSDAFPLFISDNVESIFGLEKEDVAVDVFAFGRCMEPEVSMQMERMYQNWDRKEALTAEFDYVNQQTGKKGTALFRITYDSGADIYTVVMEDISERKREEMVLQDQLTRAKEENDAKTEFLSEMSHEIRTPMNGILGLLELAKMEIDNPDVLREYLDKTQNLSHFLLHLINDILDLTRIESGKIVLQQESFDLIAMANKLRAMFLKVIEEKQLHFELRVEGFDVRRVIGDEMRLSQVVINFLSNAVKFTEPGGNVILTFRQMEKIDNKLRLMIQVRDDGKGIEPEFLSHIFRPFEQESSMIAKKYGGSGLGMSIADNIIRLMGGQIVIDSELGKGSDFTVFLSLPVAQPEDTGRQEDGDFSPNPEKIPELSERQPGSDGWNKMPQETAEEKRAEVLRNLRGARVLLAEDNDINAKITMSILERDGVRTDRVLTGRQAVETFAGSEEGYYDVILMDIQMPEMDGWEATRRIRKMERRDAGIIPIYALSANSYVEDQRRSMEAGMNDHIAKPIDYNVLKRKMSLAVQEGRNAWNAARKLK